MNNIRRKGLEKLSGLLDLELSYSHARHNFELGLPLESSLREFFRPYFPARYGFASGYLVDEHEQVSNQIDWIVFDALHSPPLLAKIHGTEGPEWFPFEGVFGCVEVKRTLTEPAFADAVRQIAVTRKLRRAPTNLLQVSPYLSINPGFLNLMQGATFHEVCNTLYVGIYAFATGDFADPDVLLAALERLAKTHDIRDLPDFVAIHGRYYVRRATLQEGTTQTIVHPFLESANCYIVVDSGQLTAGVFYTDLLAQFANTNLSAAGTATAFGKFLLSADEIAGKVKIFRYA